jgi:hypothetical protein
MGRHAKATLRQIVFDYLCAEPFQWTINPNLAFDRKAVTDSNRFTAAHWRELDSVKMLGSVFTPQHRSEASGTGRS